MLHINANIFGVFPRWLSKIILFEVTAPGSILGGLLLVFESVPTLCGFFAGLSVGDSGQCLQELSGMHSSERGHCVGREIAQKWQHLTDERQGDFSKDPKFKAYFGGHEDFLC